jgi:hypothetical protein
VVVESLEITAEGTALAGSDEGEDTHGAVVAVEEFPCLAEDIDVALGGADWVDVAVAAEPDLLVLARAELTRRS